MPNAPVPVEQVAQRFGCTVERARAQYAGNADDLERLAARARDTGRRVRSYTAEQLEERATAFRTAAQA